MHFLISTVLSLLVATQSGGPGTYTKQFSVPDERSYTVALDIHATVNKPCRWKYFDIEGFTVTNGYLRKNVGTVITWNQPLTSGKHKIRYSGTCSWKVNIR